MTDEGEEVQPAGRPSGVARLQRSDLLVDLAVAVVFTATWVVWFRMTDGAWFFVDEWALAGRGRSIGDFLEPYNNHLSVPYIAVYRIHMGLFGFAHHEVLRVIGITALVSGPALFYVTARRPLGAPWAAVAAIGLLLMSGTALEPGAMNHWGVLAAAVVAAWAVRRSAPAADWWLAGALTVGFLTAGGMVACAAGVFIYCLAGGATRRRWVCALVPTLAWALWYSVQERVEVPAHLRLNGWEAVERVVDGYVATLTSLALGSRIGAWVLLLAMVAVAVQRFRHGGRRALVPFAAWWGASLAWWLGLVQSRQILTDPNAYRYQLVCAVFLLLAFVPPEPAADAEATSAAPAARRRPAPALVAGGVLALAGLLAWANLDVTRRGANVLVFNGRQARLHLLVALAEPPVMDDQDRLGFNVGNLSRRQLVALSDLYGPGPTPFDELDEVLVGEEALWILDVDDAGEPGPACEPVDGVQHAEGELRLVTGDAEVVLRARRFGDDPVEVATLPAGSEVGVWAVRLPVEGAWTLDAPGACVLAG